MNSVAFGATVDLHSAAEHYQQYLASKSKSATSLSLLFDAELFGSLNTEEKILFTSSRPKRLSSLVL